MGDKLPTEESSVTVLQLNERIAKLIKGERSLSDIWVRGEISNATDYASTGRLYFTLKEQSSEIRAVMWSTGKLKFKPENGMKVTVRGDVAVYVQRGQYQLTVHEMQPEGMGALYIAFTELREKLEKEGLFAQKRPLPKQPEIIAVVTAETGAALQDILNTLSRRNPLVKVLLFPSTVQGGQAPESLINGIRRAQSSGADLIIFGRGGGSIEDLWAFNDEGLARAVFASVIPTISAVGHEIDFTIADFVADLRAATPTAAAELSVTDIGEVYDSLTALRADLKQRINRALGLGSERVLAIEREIGAKSPSAKLATYLTQFELLEKQVKHTIQSQIAGKRQSLITEMKRIDALSPLNVLMRGYSIVTDSRGKAILDAENVHIGSKIGIKLHKGKILAEVKEVNG
jgi:exodeoxyribonuclease VII large subunit